MISNAANPTSAYLMIKYFGAIPKIKDREGNSEIINLELSQENLTSLTKEELYNKLSELIEKYWSIDCIVNLNDPNNIELARKVFTETSRIINCERRTSGGKTNRRQRRKKTKRNRKPYRVSSRKTK